MATWRNQFVWLNPLHPDAQELLIGIVVEAVKKYDLDGVQLDDRIVWPSLEMGYDDFTKKHTPRSTTASNLPRISAMPSGARGGKRR